MLPKIKKKMLTPRSLQPCCHKISRHRDKFSRVRSGVRTVRVSPLSRPSSPLFALAPTVDAAPATQICLIVSLRFMHYSITKQPKSLFWAATHPPSKIRGGLFRSFCEILLTNQPAHRHRGKQNLLSRAKYCLYSCQ